jgi:hypothetical protein
LVKFREDIFTTQFDQIIYCYPTHLLEKNREFVQQLRNEFPKLEICLGLPDINTLNLESNILPSLLLLDDLMNDILQSETMLELFISKVHHFNISTCFTLQNYYAESKFGKTHMKNCPYRVFFYNRIELQELAKISTQISNSANFLHSNFQFLYKNFPSESSPYILIDGHFRTPLRELWCRSNIFPKTKNGEITPVYFFPNLKRKKK